MAAKQETLSSLWGRGSQSQTSTSTASGGLESETQSESLGSVDRGTGTSE